MRDDHSKQIEELKDKTNHTEQYDEIISTSPTTVNILFSKKKKQRHLIDFFFSQQIMINEIVEQIPIHQVNVNC